MTETTPLLDADAAKVRAVSVRSCARFRELDQHKLMRFRRTAEIRPRKRSKKPNKKGPADDRNQGRPRRMCVHQEQQKPDA